MTIQERPRSKVVEYPISDGKPMAESDIHRDLMFDTIAALKEYFRDQAVYVAGNNFLYFEEGNPKACVSPDTYVVFGVSSNQRDTYKVWEEGGRLPNVVFEFTSRKTRREDSGVKRQRYEETLRVPEYFQFDPRAEYLRPPLQGFRLVEGAYVPLEVVDGRLHSEELGLDLVQDGQRLRLWDPRGQRWLLSYEEAFALASVETRRAETEARNAEVEKRRTEAAQLHAEQEAIARAMAEDEVARLRAELAALRGNQPEN
jgi:Uma2 family endonuclease